MGLAKFVRISKLFGGAVSDESEREALFKEALLLTLSRASNTDENISPVEVETVRSLMKSVIGEEVSQADVRVAAASKLYEKASLDDYLSVVGRKLLPKQRTTIVQSLAEVINSDARVSTLEIDFFNRVASAIKATPAEMVGLLKKG